MSKSRRLVFSTTITLLLTVALAGSITACPGDPVTQLETVATVDAVDTAARQLALKITASDARRLNELTAQNVNHRLELRIDGVTVAQPVVREAIEGRELRITWADDETGDRIVSRIDTRTQVPLTVMVVE